MKRTLPTMCPARGYWLTAVRSSHLFSEGRFHLLLDCILLLVRQSLYRVCWVRVLHHAVCCDPLTEAPARAQKHMPETGSLGPQQKAFSELFLIGQVSTLTAGTTPCLGSQSEWVLNSFLNSCSQQLVSPETTRKSVMKFMQVCTCSEMDRISNTDKQYINYKWARIVITLSTDSLKPLYNSCHIYTSHTIPSRDPPSHIRSHQVYGFGGNP